MVVAAAEDVKAIRVVAVDVMREAVWDYKDSRPVWRHARFGSTAAFDPFPAYPHDLGLVQRTVEQVQQLWPPAWDVDLFVADREEIGRTNGHSNLHEGGHYEGEVWVKDPPRGLIMLSGKRIPPHPGMTRHLVAHEYGHNLWYMLVVARGGRHCHDDYELSAEYAELRGMQGKLHYGSGGRWHDSLQEVIADDFRIVVCDIEPEYWPHPGIAHPYEADADLAAWWAAARKVMLDWGSSR